MRNRSIEFMCKCTRKGALTVFLRTSKASCSIAVEAIFMYGVSR